MSDYDRGPYTPPSEPPLAFDARRPVRGSGPAPVALIVSVVVLIAVVAGGGFFLYRGGLRAPNQAPQPVGAPVTDTRTAPPPQAQPQEPGDGLSVYRDDGKGPAAAPTFAPPPEQPAARPAPAAPVAAAPAKPAPVAVAAAAPVKPAPAAPVAAPPKPAPAAAAPKPVAAAPAARPAPAVTGGVSVQIGAFASQAAADAGWNKAARLAPGRGKKVETVTVNGATLYRTWVTGFASHDAAQGFCDVWKSSGQGCFVR